MIYFENCGVSSAENSNSLGTLETKYDYKNTATQTINCPNHQPFLIQASNLGHNRYLFNKIHVVMIYRLKLLVAGYRETKN